MKKRGTEQRWWSALTGWLDKYQGRADFLFVYDKKQGRLERCFDKNVALSSVDAETVSSLYQAAAEGRLGLLRPNDLKPKLLTTDPEKIFAPDKEPSKETEKAPAAEKQERAETKQPEQPEKTETEAETEMTLGLDARKMERAAAEPAIVDRLRKAEAQYRQVVYAPKKAEKAVPAEASGGENSAARVRARETAAREQAVEMVRNALGSEEHISEEQGQLAEALAQMMLGVGEMEEEDREQRERVRLAREELIIAQNLFIWAAVSDKRDQEAHEARMEYLEQISEQQLLRSREWRRQMMHMARTLQQMDMSGASESECGEKIRDFLDGKVPKEPEQDQEQEDRQAISGAMVGNTLRHLCRFAASEVPLSIRHVQVGEQCCRILQQLEEYGIPLEDLELEPQELSAVQGTIEMGFLVERGLLAQAALTSGKRLPGKQHRECLRSYLVMKGMEETMVPHVEQYQAENSVGDGPVSALQIVMANPGFRADDLRSRVGRTNVMARLERMDPLRLGQMIREGNAQLAEMGRQAMLSACMMDNTPEIAQEPRAPQKGGPVL